MDEAGEAIAGQASDGTGDCDGDGYEHGIPFIS
jgi:hypothetical protein